MPAADRVEALVRDLEAIPEVLVRLSGPAWLGVDPASLVGGARQLQLTGLGSSRFAAMLIEDRLRSCGFDVEVAPSSADPPASGRLCIAISSSGHTRETVSTAERHRAGGGSVLAVTRDPGSPLARAADAVVVLPVEPESSGIATTSWAATIAGLLHLSDALCAGVGSLPQADRPTAGAMLDAAAVEGRAVLVGRGVWLPPAVEALHGVEEVAILGPWSHRAVAEQSALLLREGPRRTAAAFETAEWLHTGIYTALPNTAALLIPGSPADGELTSVIEGRGGRVVRLPATDRPPTGIPAAIAAGLLASELWRRITTARKGR